PPGIHVRFEQITVAGEPVPGVIAVVVLWTLNNYEALARAGTGVYFYIPKIQTPHEALIIEKLLSRLEGLVGVEPGAFKIKVLYEEGTAGRFLPAIAWVLRRRLLGTNVGRWDYLGSLIEMWKDDPRGVYPDPQTIGMASANMIAYQRYNALVMLMAGMNGRELSHAAPIGGMAAVMIYPTNDPYGRSRYNALDTPEKLLTPERWDSIYGVPAGDVTIEHIQHAFYMAANYGFQILNGNFAAAIDDYELSLRFMNDLATYRIDVSWLWSLLHHEAAITKDGYLKGPALTEDGVVPAANAFEIKAGTRFTKAVFDRLWDCHNEWTAACFAELDRRGDPGRFDRAKAPIIMEILKRQLLSPRYLQHSARVLFVLAEADKKESAQILDAIFDLSRDEILKRVNSGALS